nr:Chain B, Cadherin-5 [Mus musculus]
MLAELYGSDPQEELII